ncbi:MAG: ABC transporter permease [Candidatus Zixiibacteriota bacterium]|nr:MAG: ABC transporter permease [candidate division Zixibacteria bacterium]
MLKNYIKVAIRMLARHKTYSLINIAGLAVGMTVFILIALWVTDELSYDRFHDDVDHIYRIVGKGAYFEDGIDGAPAPLANAIRAEIPDVTDVARVMDVPKLVISYNDKSFYETRIMLTEQSFFNIFSFSFLYGSPQNALLNPNDVIITQNIADKYFGDENPIGKNLIVDGKYPVIVTGVVENVPDNSTFKFDIIAPLKIKGDEFAELESHWGAFMTSNYIRINPEASTDNIIRKLNGIGEKNNCPQFRDGVSFDLQPFLDVHLDGKNDYHDYADIGNSLLVYSFSVIAMFVLLIACVNFINLSTARSMVRAREVGMRKTLGAGRGNLIRQFLGETVFFSAISLVFAVVLAELSLPAFNNLVRKSLAMNLFELPLILAGFVIIAVTGVIAGLYPAFYLSSFKPANVIKSNILSVSGKSLFRKILVVFQFSLSTALLIGALVIYLQLRYINSKDLGFDKENVIHIPLKENIAARYPAVKEELLASPYIKSVTSQYNLEATIDFSTNGFVWEGGTPNFELQFHTSQVGIDYFETLNLGLVDGRYFSEEFSSDTSEAVIINEEAAVQMGLTEPVGKRFGFQELDATIIGVVKNANMESLTRAIGPRVYYPLTNFAGASERGKVLIRFAESNYGEALSHTRSVWNKFNKLSPFEFELLDDTYENLYRRERNIGFIINIFTILAIFISCLGLFGLISSVAERRTKEVGIRKILGGSVFNILYIITKDFLIPVCIANLIAWPISYLIMEKLLQNYVYRVNIHWWIFAAATFIVIAIASATVSFQAAKAALANPVNALRHE